MLAFVFRMKWYNLYITWFGVWVCLSLTRYVPVLGNYWVKASKEKRDPNIHLRDYFWKLWALGCFEKDLNYIRKCPYWCVLGYLSRTWHSKGSFVASLTTCVFVISIDWSLKLLSVQVIITYLLSFVNMDWYLHCNSTRVEILPPRFPWVLPFWDVRLVTTWHHKW